MSGTSLDGIDVALVIFPEHPAGRPELIDACTYPFTGTIREKLLRACLPGAASLPEILALDVELGECFSDALLSTLARNQLAKSDITAIGSHGQTILHHSGSGKLRYSLQIGDPNTIALKTGITTVADFRRMDIAAGGQGAPLVPAFHDTYLRSTLENRVIANIGGMANITVLATEAPVSGFDTGPGNVLMDSWTQVQCSQPYDADGAWARSGTLQLALLERWLAHPFFSLPPPKSTGREVFNLEWVVGSLGEYCTLPPADVQRTLLELTARSLANDIAQLESTVQTVLLCGGGSHNTFLRERIADLIGKVNLADTSCAGINPDWVEAMAFAWLARQRIDHQPGNITNVTGAKRNVILGGVYVPPEQASPG